MTDFLADCGSEPRRIDWRACARLLAEGRTLEETAAALACSPERVRRNILRSRRMARHIEQERDAIAREASHRLGAFSRDLARLLETEARAGNIRAILWLAERLLPAGSTNADPAKDPLSLVRAQMAQARNSLAAKCERLARHQAESGDERALPPDASSELFSGAVSPTCRSL